MRPWQGVEVEALFGTVEAFENRQPRPWMDERVVLTLSALSDAILAAPRAREFPDLIALAFWLRARNLQQIVAQYRANPGNRVGRGRTLHFAPGNVPLNFLISVVGSMLAGNVDACRLSRRSFPQQALFFGICSDLAESNPALELRERIFAFRSDHDDEFIQRLSSIADTRVIWGGDAAVKTIRNYPSRPDSLDISFPTRTSCSILDAEAVIDLNEMDFQRLTRSFRSDVFEFDQMACSSPHVIFWVGAESACDLAARKFWQSVAALNDDGEQMRAFKGIQRLTRSMVQMAQSQTPPNSVAGLDHLSVLHVADSNQLELHALPAFGFFQQVYLEQLGQIEPALKLRFQTATTFGLRANELDSLAVMPTPPDRILPIGRALDFSLIWDGYDLPVTLSRRIYISGGMN